jgi:hypothetical protein
MIWKELIDFPNCFLYEVYFNAASIAPAAQPVASQATYMRECLRILFAPEAKSRAFSSRFLSGTKTSSSSISALQALINICLTS